jgi:PDZ domain-containing secreted protein
LRDQSKLLYTIDEFRNGNIQISRLLTTSPWLAIADFLIKVRSAKHKGLSCHLIPVIKTRKITHQVIFITAFLTNEKNEVVKEVSITTKVTHDNENRFDKSKTNSYYLSDSYLQAIKGLVKHLRIFKSYNIDGILVLAVFATADNNHRFWTTYTPAEISDQLIMHEVK